MIKNVVKQIIKNKREKYSFLFDFTMCNILVIKDVTINCSNHQKKCIGSRYYHSDLSIWLSIDPMSDKYPSLSPYNYCADNPVRLIDPNGEEIGDYYDVFGNYLGTDGIDDGKVYQLKFGYIPNYQNIEINWGGILEKEHYSEIQEYSYCLGKINEVFVTGDIPTDKRIVELHPAIRMLVRDFINEANSFYDGDYIRISQGYRTYEEQNALYARGRTEGGKIVTYAKGGYSSHNFGLAFDIVGIKNGKVDYNLDWSFFSLLAKNKGFNWGGNWKFIDKPHFENLFNYTYSELRSLQRDSQGYPILIR